ncbi:hypothetical protein C8F04DRAFT_1237998 [Mycena alexandri]|uniref:Uncharacterized protein n=1 Tax=Mycena alexandri TaxID=1745969 RepID=A0AAD6SGP2_9AGAR|nr:hypothetical protein C8F04DRAFT_1237998 [Mycena alexandri]
MCPIVLSDLENRGIRSEDGPVVLPNRPETKLSHLNVAVSYTFHRITWQAGLRIGFAPGSDTSNIDKLVSTNKQDLALGYTKSNKGQIGTEVCVPESEKDAARSAAFPRDTECVKDAVEVDTESDVGGQKHAAIGEYTAARYCSVTHTPYTSTLASTSTPIRLPCPLTRPAPHSPYSPSLPLSVLLLGGHPRGDYAYIEREHEYLAAVAAPNVHAGVVTPTARCSPVHANFVSVHDTIPAHAAYTGSTRAPLRSLLDKWLQCERLYHDAQTSANPGSAT